MAFSLKKCPATVAERRRTECVFVDNGFFDLLLGKTVSESQVRTSETGASELRGRKIRVRKMRVAKVGPREVCISEIGTA
jgi:hypothetical protein